MPVLLQEKPLTLFNLFFKLNICIIGENQLPPPSSRAGNVTLSPQLKSVEGTQIWVFVCKLLA